MSRKVFISFLGATNYGPCDYQINGESFGTERFIQVSTLRMLTKNRDWSPSDKAYILLTNDAEKKNWMDEGQCNPKTKEPIKGLKGLNSDLDSLANEIGAESFPTIEPVRNLPDGNNETEIWEIFSKVFEKIQDGDELYFDITHGYRYLPMLIHVLNNYAKFLKQASVKSLTYGNYEISERGQKPGSIVDLLPLSTLQDWTFAAGQYMDNGEVKELVRLSESNEKLHGTMSDLHEVVKEMQTCRGIDIITSAKIKLVKEKIDNLDQTYLPPLTPVMDKIRTSLDDFDSNENVRNGYSAAKWCIHNGLFQQGITILMETMYTDVCISNGYDWKKRRYRDIASSSFTIVKDNILEKDWRYEKSEKEGSKKRQEKYEAYKKMIASPKLIGLMDLYQEASDLRNDIDHAGMRNNARQTDVLVDSITKLIDKIPC